MITLPAFLQMMLGTLMPGRDPLAVELQALQQAKLAGIARKLRPFNQALRNGDEHDILRYQEELKRFLEVVNAATALSAQLPALPSAQPEQAVAEPISLPADPTYMVSSATLAEAHACLTQHLPGAGQEPEWMLAVTGVKHGYMRTLEHLIDVKLAAQSSVQAAFDMQDFTRIALTLHEHGQPLHSIFHSHRFAGPPQPSATDWRLQDRLDEGGYPAIQAVFSEDGYVRFFARRPFRIEIYGKGVKHVDPETALYRIIHFGTLPHPGNPNPERRIAL